MKDLVEENMGLVISIVNRFNPKNLTEREDYIQAGRIGLWKALEKFCEDRGTKFSPYAWNPIRWEIIKEIVPSTLTQEEKRIISLRLEGNNFKDISSQLNLSRSSVKKLFNSAVKKIRDNNEE